MIFYANLSLDFGLTTYYFTPLITWVAILQFDHQNEQFWRVWKYFWQKVKMIWNFMTRTYFYAILWFYNIFNIDFFYDLMPAGTPVVALHASVQQYRDLIKWCPLGFRCNYFQCETGSDPSPLSITWPLFLLAAHPKKWCIKLISIRIWNA